MADKTKIEWTDATWNPVTGCTQVSPGCDHCYALTLAERFRGTPSHYFENGFDVTLRPDKLDQPLRWTKPRRIFVNSMSDLFHSDVPDEYIAQVFAVMALAPQHTFQVLTKRHGRMRSLLSRWTFAEIVTTWAWRIAPGRARELLRAPGTVPLPLPNVWLGVSVEDQSRADLRIPALMETPAAVRFISCEPLLGPVTLTHLHSHCPTHDFAGGFCSGPCQDRRWPDWVIVGGESGRGARPMHPAWARSLRDQCRTAGVPFLFKQWGEWAPVDQADRYEPATTGRRSSTSKTPTGGHQTVYLDRQGARKTTNDLHTFQIPTDWAQVARVGKRNAGRELDGRTWDELPPSPADGERNPDA